MKTLQSITNLFFLFSNILFLAYFLDSIGKMDQAEEYYLQSIEANIRHSNVHCVYADFLAYERGVCTILFYFIIATNILII